jgi:hypothetical protein
MAAAVLFALDRPGSNEDARTLDDVSGAAVSGGGAAAEATIGGWGPSRPILDFSREGEQFGFDDGPHFNSNLGNPDYGDERTFLDAKPADHQQAGDFRDRIDEPSGRYLVRAYIANGAIESPAELERLTAVGTSLRVELMTDADGVLIVRARLTADNAIPAEVYDTVRFHSEIGHVSAALVHGSARLYSNEHPEGVRLGDEIVGQGVPIGPVELNGEVPPGYRFSMFVTIELSVSVHGS